MTKITDTLYAFYDLEVNPNCFDIVKFVVLADLARREADCAHLHFLFVPSSVDGFRADDQFEQENREWRLRQIMLPVCSLIAACKGVTICASRDEAEFIETEVAQHIFPHGHSTQKPVQLFEWAEVAVATAMGKEVPSIQVGGQAREYIKTWIQEHAGGRQVVSITLREMSWQVERNSRVDDWLAFARSLDTEKYYPVIIRDTDAIFFDTPEKFDGLPQFSEAGVNLELRAAFYEECFLNMMVGNGPVELCALNTKVRYVMFYRFTTGSARRSIDDKEPENSLPEAGVPANGHLPISGLHQRFCWNEDTCENIRAAFDEAVLIIADNHVEIEAFRSSDVFRPTKIGDIELMALLIQANRVHHAIQILDGLRERSDFEDWCAGLLAEFLEMYVEFDVPNRGMREFGVILILSGTATVESFAENFTILEREGDAKKNALYRLLLGDVFVAVGGLDAAVVQYETSLTMVENSPEAIVKLAMVNQHMGKLPRANQLLQSAIESGIHHPKIFEKLAEVHKLQGNFRAAAQVSLQASAAKQRPLNI